MDYLEVRDIFLDGWHMRTAGNGQPDDVNADEGFNAFNEWLIAYEDEIYTAVTEREN